MPRPKHEQPTPGELEVLKILWRRGPLTVREVMDELNQSRQRAYTSVMSLLNVMADKGMLKRRPSGRAFVYQAKVDEAKTLGKLVCDLLGRAFEGSSQALVARMLDQSNPTVEEIDAIRSAIDAYQRKSKPEQPS